MTAGLPTFCLASDAQIEVAIISRRYTRALYVPRTLVFVYFADDKLVILECRLNIDPRITP